MPILYRIAVALLAPLGFEVVRETPTRDRYLDGVRYINIIGPPRMRIRKAI